MFNAAHEGTLHGLWVQGEDVAQSESNQGHVIEALQKLDLLVVQDLFLCETTKYAHLVLPAAGTLENEGSYTNGERRVQWVRPAVEPPGEARPDWAVFNDLANRLGSNRVFDSPADILDEIALAAPKLFGGIHYDRLGTDGLQWPCPDRVHPGTRSVHRDEFLRGKGKLVSIPYLAGPERVNDAYPLLLMTGRVLQHYNVGSMTRRTPSRELVGTDYLEIHPEDAASHDIEEGAITRIESRWGATRARTRFSTKVEPGTLFLSFHDPETHTNALVGPHVDPFSHCPDYKRIAVRVSKTTNGLPWYFVT
jgi:predicted molibdopterin-dependent oxidoreductase YjgC